MLIFALIQLKFILNVVKSLNSIYRICGLLEFSLALQESWTLWQEEDCSDQAVDGENQSNASHVFPVFGL